VATTTSAMSNQPDDAAAARPDRDRAHPFPTRLQHAARANAGGWVYDVDPAFDRSDPVPREAIIGAWRIGADGLPTGEFVVNRHYRPLQPPRRRVGRGWWAAGVLVVALLIAAAVILFVQ
jgi:hypothetical protein